MYLKYLSYLLRHRWWVAYYCLRKGMIWAAITHDLSKFWPDEFAPYAYHFFGGGKEAGADLAFEMAWTKHLHRNPHHPGYWIMSIRHRRGGMPATIHESVPFEMPIRCRKEALCDWCGAGRAISGRNDIVAWYEKNSATMLLGPETRAWFDSEVAKFRR
jgi:hypothetical protein